MSNELEGLDLLRKDPGTNKSATLAVGQRRFQAEALEESSTLTGFRYLLVVFSQLTGGFTTAILVLYAFFLAFAGPQFFLGYYSSTLPSIFSDDPFVAGFVILFGASPILAVCLAVVRRKFRTREWMQTTRSAFYIGLLLGFSFSAFYVSLLLIDLTGPTKFGPGAGGSGGGL